MVVPAVIVVAIFLGFAAVVETPATTTPAWKIERLKPEPNTPYIAQGLLSPIYPATPGKELLGKPMAMAVRAPNTLHEAVTAKRIDMRQALQIHKLPRQIHAAGEEHQSYSQQSYGYDPKLECNVMRKLSAVAFITMMITAPLPAIAYTQEDADACTPDAMRLCQQAIPDESRVALCLVQNKRQLSPACTIVFNRPRAASAARERPVTVRKTKFGVE